MSQSHFLVNIFLSGSGCDYKTL